MNPLTSKGGDTNVEDGRVYGASVKADAGEAANIETPSRIDKELEEAHSKRVTMEALQPEPFFNQATHNVELSKENQRHRKVLDARIAGNYTIKELAEQFDYTTASIGYILRQAWAKDYMSKRLNALAISNCDLVYGKLERLTLVAVDKQEQIMDLPLEPTYEDGNVVAPGYAETVRKTTNDILNRAYGTARQSVEITHKDARTVSDDDLIKIAESGKRN